MVLPLGQFYRISVAKDDSGKMVGGLQDNSGYIRNNDVWKVYTGGDGMDYEVDPTNNNIVYGFVQYRRSLVCVHKLRADCWAELILLQVGEIG